METGILEQLGLTPGEIKTYLALLKLGASSTGPIAKESGVSRSKLYLILDKLEKKGMASHVEKNGVLQYEAVEPTKIKDLLQEKEKELTELQKKFDQFLPQLETFHQQAGKKHEVKVYQGMKGLITCHEHTYLKLKRGDSYYYLGVPAYQPEPHHLYWQRDHLRRAGAGIKCRLLFNKDTAKKVVENRNIYKGADARYMPTNIKTPAMICGYKNTIFIAIQHPVVIAIEIVSQEIADSFKAYFDEFWKKTIPFKKPKKYEPIC